MSRKGKGGHDYGPNGEVYAVNLYFVTPRFRPTRYRAMQEHFREECEKCFSMEYHESKLSECELDEAYWHNEFVKAVGMMANAFGFEMLYGSSRRVSYSGFFTAGRWINGHPDLPGDWDTKRLNRLVWEVLD